MTNPTTVVGSLKLSAVARIYEVDASEGQLKCNIIFAGMGWYSANNEGVFEHGIFPTYSRIKIGNLKEQDYGR